MSDSNTANAQKIAGAPTTVVSGKPVVLSGLPVAMAVETTTTQVRKIASRLVIRTGRRVHKF
ncbi:hypothetical protein ACQPYK_29685 [Streptosporangium sp. CA-135522]|uniref:hypothetical protein n=1 Tax=Streptosporangium sp. CA-135522 TaxID=3240072 RepID=UPI003D8A982F